ncbi:MAG: glucan biosynthesis protein G [Candidatus Binatia bacterium]
MIHLFLLVLLFVPQKVLANGPFDYPQVVATARKLAAAAYAPPQKVPDFLRKISYDAFRDIRFKPERTLWADENSRFGIQLIHPGLYFTNSVAINVYDSKGVHRVPFSTDLFTYGRNTFKENIRPNLGFAGFRLTYPLNHPKQQNHVLVFAGASYFRGVARKQVFGLSARGLAIDTGLPSGEEFPYFKEFWLEKPGPNARVIRILALLDSESVTGAYRFDIHPGDQTIAEVSATLFERKRPKMLGIAPLTSMFFYDETKSRPAGNWRPEVHDSDGLLIAAASGEWLWRPLANPDKLLINSFEVDGLRGFGLLQRDRAFPHYEDLEARYDLRPNAWIVPTSEWGKGEVKLVQIPTKNEINDNIVAFWTPRNLPPPGKPIEFSYRIHFHAQEPNGVERGRSVATRIGEGDEKGSKRVVIDFAGRRLTALLEHAQVQGVVTVGQEGKLVQQNVLKNAVTGGWRLAFQVIPPKGKPLELRAYLKNGKATVTETWSYLLPES